MVFCLAAWYSQRGYSERAYYMVLLARSAFRSSLATLLLCALVVVVVIPPLVAVVVVVVVVVGALLTRFADFRCVFIALAPGSSSRRSRSSDYCTY